MFNHNDSLFDNIIGGLFLGSLFYLFHLDGKQTAYKEIEDQKQKDALRDLQRRFEELKRNHL